MHMPTADTVALLADVSFHSSYLYATLQSPTKCRNDCIDNFKHDFKSAMLAQSQHAIGVSRCMIQ
jgi:hypothetical protein